MGARVLMNHALVNYRGRVAHGVPQLVQKYATRIDNGATAKAPRDTGTLKRSISHGMLSPTSAWIGSRNVPYARIQDLGGQTSNQYGPNSGHIRGNRYLTQTFADEVGHFQGDLRALMRP